MTRKQNQLVDAIIADMRGRPNAWAWSHYGRHMVENDKGVGVWVANKLYGMYIELNDAQVMGGVQHWSFFQGWRRRLMNAVKELPCVNGDDLIGAAIKALESAK